MKKFSFLFLLGIFVFITGCSLDGNGNTGNTGDNFYFTTGTGLFSLLSGKDQKYLYNRKMEKPDIKEIENLEYMYSGFDETWTLNISPDILDQLSPEEGCEEIQLLDSYDRHYKTVSIDEIKAGNVEVTGNYHGRGLDISLSDQQKEFLQKHGWIIFDPGELWNYWYSDLAMLDQEEWTLYYDRIGGEYAENERYPYNTIFVTTDMLLHFYHKIFSNSLKYYEESVARPNMQYLAQTMFDKFVNLYESNKDNDLAPYYSFLVAYRSIPNAIFVPYEEINDAIEWKINNMDYNDYEAWQNGSDLTKNEMNNLIKKRFDSIKSNIPSEYQDLAETTLKKIFTASESRAEDVLLSKFASQNNDDFFITQDYTQFTPRGHYTNSSLLISYFMGMKRFMREKLYFNNVDQSKAALIMMNNIRNDELKGFDELYSFVQKIIGQDDDVNVYDLQKYISDKGWTSDQDILMKLSDVEQTELSQLRPQKLIATHYESNGTSEQEVKDETAGFVFFGKKFTIDSYIFDKMTAGSAEAEYEYKPNLHTTFIVPEILINTGIIRDVVNLWMDNAKQKYEFTQKKIDAYNRAKSETQDELNQFDFGVSIYHQWLDSMSWLFAIKDPNIPYFMEDPLYQYKQLNTFQGNYTELKHDTILYIKQVMAEMGGPGFEDCTVNFDIPALPVPKGYIEPNIDLIDGLLKLVDDTKHFFQGNDKYLEFAQFLMFVRDLAIKQTKNEIIDDSDFEKLRTYYGELIQIMYPMMLTDGDEDFISILIADIFTSENNGPLYIATGRPHLMITNIKDANGARAVIGPVYSTFEFYESDDVIPSENGRYTDDDRQAGYDSMDKKVNYTIPMKKLLEHK